MPDFEGGGTTEVVVGTITGDQGNPNSVTNGWPVKVTDGTSVLGTPAHPLSVDGSSVTQPVSAATLPLPVGAATDATLSTLTKPSDQQHVIVDSSASVAVTGTFFQAMQPVSAAALPLPAGAAVAAKQPSIGSAGTASTDVITVQGIAGATPLPVTLTGGSIEIGTVDQGTGGSSAWKVDGSAVTQPISGTVSVSGTVPVSAVVLPLPTGAATDAKLDDKFGDLGQKNMAGSAPVTIASDQSAIPVSGTVYVTGTVPISAVALPLPSGAATESTLATLTKPSDQQHVIVDSSASIPVTGVFFQTTQPVSGTVSVSGTTAVSAAALPLPSGASTSAKQPSLGTAGTSATDVITVQGIAGATPIPVSLSTASIEIGTVDQGTGGSSAWKVDGSGVTQPVSIASSVAVTGTFFQATQPVSAVSLPLPSGAATEATLATRTKPSDQQHVIIDSSTSIAVTGPVTDANLDEKFGDLGQAAMAASAPVVIASDQSSIPVTGAFFQATQPVSAASLPLPTGAAVSAKQPSLGTAGSASADVITVQGVASMTALKVDGSAVTQPVTGTFFQATQPVSASSLPLPTGAATEATLLTRTKPSDQQHVIVDSSATVAVTGAFFQATQPVSAASLPLPSGAATAAKQPAIGTAGTASADVLTVQGKASMTPLLVDGSGVTQPISGTVSASQSGTWTVQPGNTANTTAWKVDGSAVTQPVSGTITANIGTSGSLALDATLTGGTQKSKLVDAGGTNVATISAGGALKVDGSATTQPVSGTFFQVTQPVSGPLTDAQLRATPVPVSGTVTAGNASVSATGAAPPASATYAGASVTTAAPSYTTGQMSALSLSTAGNLRVDGSSVTQPVSAASLPLPTGASTSAKQPALGVAGTASTDVLTVQGAAAMTALKVDGSAVTQPVSGTVTATANIGTTNGLALDATLTGGTQKTKIVDSGGTNLATISAGGALKVDGSAVTQPVSGTFFQTTQPVSAAALPLPAGAATEATLATRTKPSDQQHVIIDSSASIPVTGTFFQATQPISGAVTTTVSDYIPATGTVTALDTGTSNLTGANGQVFYFGTPTANSAVVFATAGLSSITLSSGGLGSGTLVVEVTLDGGSFWIRSNVYQVGTQSYANGFVAPFVATVNVLGMTNVRVRSITSWSSTATITARGSSTTRNVTIGDALPSGANTIGAVTQASGPWTQNLTKVGGSNILIGQTTMAASLPVALASDQSSLPVTGTFFQATQPVSITDTQGSGTISALNATVVANTAGASTVTFYITGTWVATLSIEGTVDGTNWFSVNGDVDATDTIESSTTINTFITVGCGGFSGVRLRASAYTSGTATGAYNSGLGVNFVEVFSTNPASLMATVVGQGTAGTPAGGILTVQGVSGGTPLAIRAGDITSFMACTSAAVSTTATAATTTSIAYLFHSAASTKTIKIRKILVTGSVSGTPAVQASVQGAFITAQNATPGGTLQTVNGLNRANTTDATNVFRTGATGAPARVTGDLLSGSLGTSNGQFTWEADISAQPIVLRAGTAEGFEIRTLVNTVALAATAIAANVTYYWTEE